MALSYDKSNYFAGGTRLYVQKAGTTGLLDLGNVINPSISPATENLEHFTSRFGTRRRDRREQTQRSYSISFTLDEFSPENLALVFSAGSGDPTALAQTAQTDFTEDITVVLNRGIRLTYRKVSNVTIGDAHGVEGETFRVDCKAGIITFLSGHTFENGEVVTVEYDAAAISGWQLNPGVMTGIQQLDSVVFLMIGVDGNVHEWNFISATLDVEGDLSFPDADWASVGFVIDVLDDGSHTCDSDQGTPFGSFLSYQ